MEEGEGRRGTSRSSVEARIKGMESRRPVREPSISRPPPAPVAQGIERHPPKVGVAGSNPAEGTSGVTPPPE